MSIHQKFVFAAVLCSAASPAFAQHGGARGGGGGGGAHASVSVSVPARGPEPFRGVARVATPGAVDVRPHVEAGTRWVGHDQGARDARFHLDHPWAAGRFGGSMGNGTPYRLGRWDGGRHRFFVGGSYFGIASPDWGYVNDWDWTNDQITLYPDPDHDGWYLAYNVRLGTYVHVEYDGV